MRNHRAVPGNQTVAIGFNGRAIEIDVAWMRPDRIHRPLLVFLHEGLGSIAMWRDFPRALCEAGDYRGMMFSRYGYGRSTPRPPDETWDADYLHRQACEALPALFAALGIGPGRPHGVPWLFGHSDGGSIALIHAATFPAAVQGIVVAAPHILVEDVALHGIEETREAYLHAGLRERLARYHEDVDSAFWAWADSWLHPAFRAMDLRPLLPGLRCPVLAMQGENDHYGTMLQIDGIRELAPQTVLFKLAECGHAPHQDQRDAVIARTVAFIDGANDR
jgi:pimeloyl-ACP methyl ester carboxylesterase